MSNRNPITSTESPSSAGADKRFFDEANATFQSDGGWYDTSVPDTAMTTRATQGSRYQRPYLEEDEGDLMAEADAAMDANPGFGSYLDEQVVGNQISSTTLALKDIQSKLGTKILPMSTRNPDQGKEHSFGFPSWDTLESQEDGAPLIKGEHLAEVQRGPAVRLVKGIENNQGRDSAERQATQQDDKHAPPSSGSLTNGEGLEETWTDEDLKEFRRGGDGRR
ncbi:hypothetical protein BDW66DRAFT_165373 [Aspergillus desertorum]